MDPGGAFSLLLGSFQQAVELRISHIDLVEQLVEVSCFVANITLEPVWKEQPDKPLKAQNPIERRRPINPAVWQARTKEDAVAADRFHVRPC